MKHDEGNNHNETIPNKKVYIYPIKDTDGTPLDLINVLTHVSSIGVSNAGGELNNSARRAEADKLVLDRVDTFIGHTNRGEYIKVGSTENLSAPGVIFRYASYVREQEALAAIATSKEMNMR